MAIHERVGELLGKYDAKYLANNIKPWTPDYKLTLTKVENTIITCRLCRGTKFIFTSSSVTHSLNQTVCPNCSGTGEMFSNWSS